MEPVLSICAGIGLAAACGFRIFVPLLIMSIAAYSGHLNLSSSFAWLGTPAALTTLSIATALEIGAYYIPWLDNMLDTIASPAAVVAGAVVATSTMSDMSPFLQWTLGIIGGGAAAGVVQGGTVLTRALSTTTSGGLANPIVATAELGMSIFTTLLAMVAPILAVIVVIGLAIFIGRKVYTRYNKPVPANG